MLQLNSVSAGYRSIQILSDVSIAAKPGQITVIVGPNGSGKSTLLKSIAGLTSLYSGEILVDGQVISRRPPHDIAKLGVAYLPQTESTFTNLTVAENLKMAGYTIAQTEIESRLNSALEIFPKLRSYMSSKVSSLSGGERQMVAMTMALLRNPRVILFDEPTANLAPIVATQVLTTISQISMSPGIITLLVEQNATRALQIGQYAYLLVNGRVGFQGTTKDLLEHQELGRLYLGLGTPPTRPEMK